MLMKKKAEEKEKAVKTPLEDQAIKPQESAPDPKAEEWAEKTNGLVKIML